LPATPNRQKQRWAIGALIAATSASIVLSLSAWAGGDEAPGGGPPAMHMMDGPGGMPFGGRHLNHMLDEVNATQAQRDQIKQLVDKAQVDLKALHEQGRTLHEQGLKLWAQPTLDSAAAETLRQSMLAQHDKVSKRMMQLMLDVGKVLTPEQRAKIADQMQKHHADMMQRMKERMAASQPGDGHHGHRQPQEQ
jgi:Spy/CpxP family protein refolding chaperone